MRFVISMLAVLLASTAQAKTGLQVVCQLIADEKGRALVSEGSCDAAQSPASTFKVALSLMGFDSGKLQSANAPKLPFIEGYRAYLPEWGQATDQQHWMNYSVVWYSQELAKTLGEEAIGSYLAKFQYGNLDMRGHSGADFWIGSSLKISPAQQSGFIRKLMLGDLPVSESAIEQTRVIMDLGQQANGWQLFGKTGAATPRDARGNRLPAKAFGWFIGWAERGDRKVSFVKLIQSPKKERKSLGLLARDQVIETYFSKDSPL
jgi:beta-lactamase class D